MTVRVELDYGTGTLAADLPNSTLVLGPAGWPEPAPADPWESTRAALADPLGMSRLAELVGAGSRVAIAFPDRVKGGAHAAAHRKVALPVIVDALLDAGVAETDIALVCAIGLHRKNTAEEMQAYLPDGFLTRFRGRIANHDAEDPDGILDLGTSALGDPVAFNRTCGEADLCIVLGHVQGNPYGGFSGGHKTFTTGLTTWRSIAGHHTPATMHRPDFIPISPRSRFRAQLEAIGDAIQARTGTPIMCVDAVIGEGAAVLATRAGAVRDVERATWPLAERRTDVVVETEPVDVLVFGLPRDFHYGPGMGTNPILVSQAIAATVHRCAGLLRPGGVAVVTAWCDGWWNDGWFPSYRETFERYAAAESVRDMAADIEEMATRPDLVESYRRGAYHPFHAFSMLSMAELGLRYTSRTIVVGARRPGLAHAMGHATAPSIDAALRLAERDVGTRPRIAALPGFLHGVPRHLSART